MQSRKLKIWMIDSLTGNNYSVYLCMGLKKAGLDISLVVTEDRKIEFPIDFPLLKLSPPKGKKQSRIIKLIKYVNFLFKLLYNTKKSRIDVIHFQFFRRRRLESIFFLILRLLGVNLVHTVHDVSPLDKNKLDHLFNVLVYKSANILIVHSTNNKQLLLSKVKINPEKIKVVPHGNFDHFLPKILMSKEDARNKLSLDSEDKVLLFFGFIKEYKGLDVLLGASEIASKTVSNLTLLIAGACESATIENSYKEMINKLPDSIKVISHFDFIPLEKVPEYFIACDVVILPYKRISHSGVLHLSYSFSRAIIGTNVGDFLEFIVDGESGSLAESNDESGLANSIMKFFQNSDNIVRMGENAKRMSDTMFSWDSIAIEMNNIYSSFNLN